MFPFPYVMGYDIRPLQTMIEKQDLLLQATEKEWIVFFDHDPIYDCATIGMTEKGFQIKEKGKLAEFI